MPRLFVAAALVLWFGPAALAQQPPAPVPLYPGATPQPPPVAAQPSPSAESPAAERVFCHQAVAIRFPPRASVPARYRRFVGIFSDASWTPQLCAALIVENVKPDGIASLLYVFGPMNAEGRGPGGVLHGTGIIRGEELRFQNSDGSQFAFRPLYADLDGRLTTPKGQTYNAVFKRTL